MEVDLSYSFSGLPMEILVSIFSYLDLRDILEAGMTCRSWCEASQAPSIQRKCNSVFANQDDFLKGAKNCLVRPQFGFRTNLILRNLSLSPASIPDSTWGSLRSLTLHKIDISEKDTIRLLSKCESLQELALIDMREIFMTGLFLSSPTDIGALSQSLSDVRVLNLSVNSYMSDALFVNLTSCMPLLTDLILDHNNILNHKGTYKKFYPERENEPLKPSPSVFTFRQIIGFVRERAQKLRKLSFCNCGLGGPEVEDIASAPNLDLTFFEVGKCASVTQESLLKLSQSQKNLSHLGADFCRRLFLDYPATSELIFEEFSKTLESISLKGHSIPTGFQSYLPHLKKLKKIVLSESDIPSRVIAEAFENSAHLGQTLRNLSLTHFYSEPDNMKRALKSLRSLRELDLRSCHEGVTDDTLQTVVENCRQLKVLRLSHCRRITDVGLSGKSTSEIEKFFEEFRKDGKIFLGSSAEYALLQEVKLRRVLEEERKSKNETNSTGNAETPTAQNESWSIDSLKYLKTFEGAQLQISDFSLKYSFNFDNLKAVDLSNCAKITDEGLIALGENNRGLERLSLPYSAITDLGLAAFSAKVPRLFFLNISFCLEISFAGIIHFAEFNRRLAFLDVSFCKLMRTRDVDELQRRLPSLRSVEKRGLDVNEAIFEDLASAPAPPAPPPMP